MKACVYLLLAPIQDQHNYGGSRTLKKKKKVKMRKKRGGMDCKILCSQTYITATAIFCFSFDAYLEISCTG